MQGIKRFRLRILTQLSRKIKVLSLQALLGLWLLQKSEMNKCPPWYKLISSVGYSACLIELSSTLVYCNYHNISNKLQVVYSGCWITKVCFTTCHVCFFLNQQHTSGILYARSAYYFGAPEIFRLVLVVRSLIF